MEANIEVKTTSGKRIKVIKLIGNTNIYAILPLESHISLAFTTYEEALEYFIKKEIEDKK